ncbi:MAG TPA: hypothetical protein PKZ41_00255 [Candidatus Omnitrophota bacterium]|nr:hypothetical protein [Candidatus Omnitrophota bacterium]
MKKKIYYLLAQEELNKYMGDANIISPPVRLSEIEFSRLVEGNKVSRCIWTYEGMGEDTKKLKATIANLKKIRAQKCKYFFFLDHMLAKWYIRGKETKLSPMDLKFLMVLLGTIPPQTYTPREIKTQVWKNTTVGESSFTSALYELRKTIRKSNPRKDQEAITTNTCPEGVAYGIAPDLKFCIIYK